MSSLHLSNIAKRFASQGEGPDETEQLARELAEKSWVAKVSFLPGGLAVLGTDGSVHAIGTGYWTTA